jgi:Spy/CpxP family protein refolding chaperone
MRAPLDVLKAKLKLTDAQVAQVKALREAFVAKRDAFRAQVQKDRAEMQKLYAAADPDEGKILSQMRKIREQRGPLMEERVKARLALRKLLTPEQRKLLPAGCPQMGPGGGKGWGGGRGRCGEGGCGWGRGKGGGRGGGWGGGPN